MYYLLLLWLLYCSIRAASERMNLSPWFRTCPPFSQAHPFFHNNNVITGRGGKKRKNISSIFLFFSVKNRFGHSRRRFKNGLFLHVWCQIEHAASFSRGEELLKGSLGQHHHRSRWGRTIIDPFFLRWSCMNEEDSLTPPPFVVFSFPQRFVWQVFTISKDLVPCVLSKILATVADEMCRLMQCVSSFSKNGALQVFSSHTHSKQLQVSFPRLWESHVCDCRLPS